MAPSPFPATNSKPGTGQVHLKLLPPSIPTFSTLNYTYPLKLLPSQPHRLRSSTSDVTPSWQHGDHRSKANNVLPDSDSTTNEDDFNANGRTLFRPTLVPLLFLLTYGGGMLAGDTTAIEMTLEAGTRLTAATQGMTRIYGPPPVKHATSNGISSSTPTAPLVSSAQVQKPVTSQSLTVHVHAQAALWLAPDPIQPFLSSVSTQTQRFYLHGTTASIGLVDWICEGRKSRGESWTLESWRGKNEIWLVGNQANVTSTRSAKKHAMDDNPGGANKRDRLLVRDNVILASPKSRGHRNGLSATPQIPTSMDGHGIIGTILLCGPAFHTLSSFFAQEFSALDRIGGKKWDPVPNISIPTSSPASTDNFSNQAQISTSTAQEEQQKGEEEEKRLKNWRTARHHQEKVDGVLWTYTSLPQETRGGVTIVKFAAREVEGAKKWLSEMLKMEGSIGREFGDGGLMFVR